MHLDKATKANRWLEVCYRRLNRTRAEIQEVLKVNNSLSPTETPLIPNWHVFAESSMFDCRPGDISFELYKVFLLPRDQLALASLHHSRLEQVGAHKPLIHTKLYLLRLRQWRKTSTVLRCRGTPTPNSPATNSHRTSSLAAPPPVTMSLF
ncbi:hypothetical protein Salat_2594100 [Sesamum alatum]|uniref:Uncharacterized protein n=1 Tax=Sesamum alatum TaxID=300844 RepID=A0AAE1XP10_9LAMI|nr:hypothetical protein Salat_2594100 [Sesamum alatum]